VKVAEAALSRLHHLPSQHWRVEEVQLFWARGELETAKCMMKTLIADMETVRLARCDCFASCVRSILCASLSKTHLRRHRYITTSNEYLTSSKIILSAAVAKNLV